MHFYSRDPDKSQRQALTCEDQSKLVTILFLDHRSSKNTLLSESLIPLLSSLKGAKEDPLLWFRVPTERQHCWTFIFHVVELASIKYRWQFLSRKTKYILQSSCKTLHWAHYIYTKFICKSEPCSCKTQTSPCNCVFTHHKKHLFPGGCGKDSFHNAQSLASLKV